LRDLKYTAPYMHNGVFATLDEVIEFYDKGGGQDSELKPLNMTASEKKALKEFLLTLSGDPVIVKDPGQPDMQVWTAYGKN
jgi:cytochrome c peroxidase